MLRIGWFATGRGETSPKLLGAAVDAIRSGRLDAEIAFVFSNRERGEYEATDAFFDGVRTLDIPLVTLSDQRFRREAGGAVARSGQPLPRWRTEYDRAVVALLSDYAWDLGMLAGYMLIATAPLHESHTLLNLHPAAPGQPAGTWQQVIWQLMEQRVDYGGVRIHIVTPELDQGPIATYCTYPLRGATIDLLWRGLGTRTVAEVRETEGEANALFQEIHRRGVAREVPLVVETLRAFASGRLHWDEGRILAGTTRIVGGYDLSPEIEGSLARAPVA